MIKWAIRLAVLATIIIQLVVSLAQDAARTTPIYPYDAFGLAWSSDSQQVVFTSSILLGEWLTYNLATEALTQSEQYPTVELEQQCAGINSTRYDALSPNRHFLTYNEVSERVYNIWIGIADCTTGERFAAEARISNGLTRILWSEDSQAFVRNHQINAGVAYEAQYVTHYTENMQQMYWYSIEEIRIEDSIYHALRVYDISRDGRYVLMHIRERPSDPYQLYLYDARIPANGKFVDVPLVAATATFAPGDETKLWLFTDTGIIQYDLITEETTIVTDVLTLSNQFPFIPYDAYYFSPDGHHLAALGEGGLYVVDLKDYVLQAASGSELENANVDNSGLLRLRLELACPDHAGEAIIGHVFNPNREAVTVDWGQGIYNDLLPRGVVEVPGGSEELPGEATFELEAEVSPGNLVPIFVDGVFHDQRTCIVPREG